MFMKHYAPNRCEPSIEFRGEGDRADVNGEVKFFGGGPGGGGRGESGVRVDVNEETKFL